MPRPDLSKSYKLQIAVLTVSDSRTADHDHSGDKLVDWVNRAGHQLNDRALLPNNQYQLRAQLSLWIASAQIQVVLINGGTGFAGGNCTIAAIGPLFDRAIPGFGELFRHLSFSELGSAAIQSGACAGLANGTLIFALPGSGGACDLAMQHIILPQLDGTTGPCNFVAHLKNSPGKACGA